MKINRNGFSLLEVIASLFIVGIIITTTLTLFMEMRKNISTYSTLTMELADAQNTMEASKTILIYNNDPAATTCLISIVDNTDTQICTIEGTSLYVPYYNTKGLLIFVRSLQ